jgi:nicotinate-nucleotide adenylyltransferase
MRRAAKEPGGRRPGPYDAAMRVGLLGGSFDPVHRGHIALAEAARDALRLDRVLLVVAAGQPLKPSGPAASAEDRYAMLRLAARGRPGLEASDLELRRPAPSYTVDTVREVRRGLPPGTEIVLLLGSDALADFPLWKEAAALRGLATVAACRRKGLPPPAGADLVFEADLPEVSSTEVRRRVAAGEGIEGLVPPDVAAYVVERGLYRA